MAHNANELIVVNGDAGYVFNLRSLAFQKITDEGYPGAFLAAPRERDDPVPRVGRAMDRQPGPAFAVVDPQPPDPGGDRGDRVRPLAGGDAGAQPDQGMTPGISLAVPRPAPPDRDFHLDHGLQPVDVRALEQADLDQSHGSRRIATRGPRRLAPMTTGTTATDLEIDALRGSIASDLPAYLADLEKLVNIDCGT